MLYKNSWHWNGGLLNLTLQNSRHPSHFWRKWSKIVPRANSIAVVACRNFGQTFQSKISGSAKARFMKTKQHRTRSQCSKNQIKIHDPNSSAGFLISSSVFAQLDAFQSWTIQLDSAILSGTVSGTSCFSKFLSSAKAAAIAPPFQWK